MTRRPQPYQVLDLAVVALGIGALALAIPKWTSADTQFGWGLIAIPLVCLVSAFPLVLLRPGGDVEIGFDAAVLIGLGLLLPHPQAMVICNAAKDAYDYLGSPEGELALAEACVYLATAPKSNAVYTAFKAATQAAKQHGSLLPPKHILNAPTKLMKGEGYGDGYRYDHDEPDAFSGQDYFPEKMGRQTFYDPPERGFERDIRKRLDWWAKLRKERSGR